MQQDTTQQNTTNYTKLGITIVISLVVVGLLGYGGYSFLNFREDVKQEDNRYFDQLKVSNIKSIQSTLKIFLLDKELEKLEGELEKLEGGVFPYSLDEIEISNRDGTLMQTLVYGTSIDKTEYVLGIDLGDENHPLLIGNDGYVFFVNCNAPTYCVTGSKRDIFEEIF